MGTDEEGRTMAIKITRKNVGEAYVYEPVGDVPEGVRFDMPRQEQGQIVSRAWGGYERGEHDAGAPYMRISDESGPSVSYYRLARTEKLAESR